MDFCSHYEYEIRFLSLPFFQENQRMREPTAEEIKSLQKEFEDDARERAAEIAKGEQKDAELIKRREAGEIGISHGFDNVVSFIMIGFALVVALGLILMTFGTPHI